MEEEKKTKPWRILEFYSGIGGMRYSLMKAGMQAEVVEAFDINDTANDVYQHNFGHRPFQGNIQSLTSIELDKYRADAWLLSPPCQPYTRQGLQKHSADARATSFIRILELVPHMLQPPVMMFVENVVGFETSDTHMQLMEILAENGYVTQEYILSPLQFGVPYSRPRYFCLAKRKPLSFRNPSFNNQLLQTPVFVAHDSPKSMDQTCQADVRWDKSDIFCQPIKKFLETSYYSVSEEMEDGCITDGEIATHSKGNNDNTSSFDEYSVPLSLIQRWGSAMDIVFPNSKRCCCFTKSYYRYVKGTGSLLATVQLTEKYDNKCSLEKFGLRYFTPREVANLHSFPEDFNFPAHISLKQRYALLGNSLSVAVVSPLLQYLFEEFG